MQNGMKIDIRQRNRDAMMFVLDDCHGSYNKGINACKQNKDP